MSSNQASLPPLPLPARIRLRFTGAVDQAAIRLIDHGHVDAAERLWRACGLWQQARPRP
ncbi:hypothetical protein ACIRJM_23070 [Streptomyces sp. NPDC102405]|uniref:hypothetical protein n=1 Tax=Streptomyces sp. NPDC102405 TaxID=3366170 RepID=UPI00381FF363